MDFDLQSQYKPSGDQPSAIQSILDGYDSGERVITLLGATGTGKTFTMANIIRALGIPTIIISHNKTLAAQLATECKHFFPRNAVHYFVSYFDYYQPEAYMPQRDVYVEKEATINEEIEMYRLATMSSLVSREDVVIVSSVSALYGLGSKQVFAESVLHVRAGEKYDIATIKQHLLRIQYKPIGSSGELVPGTFDTKGDMIDIYSSTERHVYRLLFDEDVLERIQRKDATTRQTIDIQEQARIRPATQFLQDMDQLKQITTAITDEMEVRYDELMKAGKMLEAERIKKRTIYDMRMIQETGFCNGIENYSRWFDGRVPGQPPETIFDYFPDEMLVIVDESHMSLPQLRGMPAGDRSRKTVLVDYGFRLPSAFDHRPINFEELQYFLGRYDTTKGTPTTLAAKKNYNPQQIDPALIDHHRKRNVYTLFVSATPGEYELEVSDRIVEQVIRPTGLLDPHTNVYPKGGDVSYLIDSIERLLEKKPHLKKYLTGYDHDIDLMDVFYRD